MDGRVRYLTISQGTFDRDTLSMPLASLPPLPRDSDWTTAEIFRDPVIKRLEATVSKQELRGIQETWHPTFIDCLHLERVERLTPWAF